MKKSTLISKVAITSLAAIAFSSLETKSARAADLLWDWSALSQTWDAGTTSSWIDMQTGAISKIFTDGDNVSFLAGAGTKAVSVAGTVYTGRLSINAGSGDDYSYTGKVWLNASSSIYLDGGTVTFQDIGKGAGTANDNLDIRLNLLGSGTVVFTGSTSSFAGSGSIFIDKDIIVEAGDKNTPTAAGGIGQSIVYNYGTIRYYREGDYELRKEIIGDGTIEKYGSGLMTFAGVNGQLRNATLKVMEGAVGVVNADVNFVIGGDTSGQNLGVKLYMDTGTYFNMNGSVVVLREFSLLGGTATIQHGGNRNKSEVFIIGNGADVRDVKFRDNGAGGVYNAATDSSPGEFGMTTDATRPSAKAFSLWFGRYDENPATYYIGNIENTYTAETRFGNRKTVIVDGTNGMTPFGYGKMDMTWGSSVVIKSNNVTLKNFEYVLGDAARFIIKGQNLTIGNSYKLTGDANSPTLTWDRVPVWHIYGGGSGIYAYENVSIYGEVNVHNNDNGFFVAAGKTMTFTGYMHNEDNNWDPMRKKGAGTIVLDQGITKLLYIVDEGTLKIGANSQLTAGTLLSGEANNRNIRIAEGATMDISAWTGKVGGVPLAFEGSDTNLGAGHWRNIENKGTFIGDIKITGTGGVVVGDYKSDNIIQMAKLIGNLTIEGGQSSNIGIINGNLSVSGGVINGNVGSVTGNFVYSGGTMAGVGSVGGSVTGTGGSLGHISTIGTNLSLTGVTWSIDRGKGVSVGGNVSIDGTSKIVLTTKGARNGDTLITAGGTVTLGSGIVVEGLFVRQTGATVVDNAGNIKLSITTDVASLAWDWANTADTGGAYSNVWNNTQKTWVGGTLMFVDEDIVSFTSPAGAKSIKVEAGTLDNGVRVGGLDIATVAGDTLKFGGNRIVLLGDMDVTGAGTVTLKNLGFTASSELTVNGTGTVVYKIPLSTTEGTTVNALHKVTLDGGATLEGSSISAGIYDIGNATVKASLQGSATTTANVHGNLVLAAENALSGGMAVDLNSGSLTSTVKNGFNGINVRMADNTTIRLNGTNNMLQQVRAANGISAANVIVENGNATPATLSIAYQLNGNNKLDLDGVLFRDGAGGGALTLSINTYYGGYKSGSQVYFNTKNEYTGGTYFNGWDCGVNFTHGEAFGTGPIYHYANRIYALETMTIANDFHTADRSIVGGETHYSPLLFIESGKTLTFTGDIVIPRGTNLQIRNTMDDRRAEEVTVAFQPSSPYASIDGWINIGSGVRINISASGASGTTNPTDLPRLQLAGWANLYFDDTMTVSSIFSTYESDATFLVPAGKTLTLTGYFQPRLTRLEESRLDGERWVSLGYDRDDSIDKGNIVFAGTGLSNPALGALGAIYQATNTRFTIHHGVTLQLGNNDRTGNVNSIFGYRHSTNNDADDVTWFNLLQDAKLIVNWSGDYLMNFRFENSDKNRGTFVKKGDGLATIARCVSLYGDILIEEGGINFAASKKYNTQFKQSSWDAMNSYMSIRIGTGTTAILDFITAGGGASHTTNTLISGEGDLVVGAFLDPYDAAFISTYVLSNTDYSGSTTVTANNVLNITSPQFKSKDIIIDEAATLTLGTLDLNFDTFSNKGTFTGGLVRMDSATYANEGTVNSAVYVTDSVINGLGTINGVVNLSGNTVLVNGKQPGTIAVTGNTALDNNTLTFRTGDLLDITGSLTAGTNNTLQLIAGKGGLQAGTYTLIQYSDVATPVTTGFVVDPNARAGALTVDTSTAGKVNVIVGTIEDRTWASASAGGNWTFGADANWDEGDYFNLDNVTFGAVGVGTIAVDANGVIAGNIIVEENGYIFTGGSIGGALEVAADKTVTFRNAGLNLGNITVATGATLALDLSDDGVVVSHLDGAGVVEKLGSNVLKWNVTDTDGAVEPTATFTGLIKVTGGTLDLINTTTADIELNGGTLTSTSMAKVGSAVTLTADSTIDLAGAAFTKGAYSKWVNSIDTNGYNLVLKNGALDNTLGVAISNSSNIDAAASVYDATKLGEALIVTDITLENGSINRPLRPADNNSVLRIQGDRMNSLLSTYATIDLNNSAKMTVEVVGEANAWARNFLIGDGEFVKTGTGTFSFAPIHLDDYYVKGSNDFQYVGMSFSGTITVDEGTLEFMRTVDSDNWNQRQPFAGDHLNPTQAKIVINDGAYLATKYHGNLGSYKGGIPEVTINEGGTFLAGWDTFIDTLVMYGDAKVAHRYWSSLRAMRLSNLDGTTNDASLDSSSAHITVHGGTGATVLNPSTAIIATERFTMSEGNWYLTVDPEAVLKVVSQIEVGNDSVRWLKIDGGGTVIFAENPTSDMSQTTIDLLEGSTLKVGYDDLISEAGGFGNAKINNQGTLVYNRQNGYDLNVTISGTGDLIKNRVGQMSVTKVNTFTGLFTINEGSVRLSSSNNGSFASDILIKKDALFNMTSYTNGYAIGAKENLTTKQYVVVEAGGSMTGTALLNNGAVLYSQGTTEAVTINAGATAGGQFGSSSNTGHVTVSGGTLVGGTMADLINGGTYTPVAGETSLVKGNLSIAGGSTIKLDINNSSNTSDKIVYTGILTLNAGMANKIKLDLNNLNTASTTGANGTYVLFEGDNHYTAAQFAGMSAWFKYNRATFDFTTSTDEQIIAIISGSESLNLTWAGGTSGVWKDNDETNLIWKRTGALTDPSTYFVALDTVTFDASIVDSGNTVTVTGGVAPKQMTVTGKDYTFTGTGGISTDALGTGLTISGVKATFNNGVNAFSKVTLSDSASTLNLGDGQTTADYIISGAGNLQKSGSSVLDLSSRTGVNANTYTGKTTITGGTLKIASLDNINASSTADIELNGGVLQTAAALDLSNGGTRSITVGSSGGSINVDDTFTAQAKLATISGAFTKLGAGDLEISGVTAFTKTVNVNNGTLKIGAASTFADLRGMAGATLDANNTVVTVQSGSFAGTIDNMNKLIIKHLDSGVTGHSFKYDAGISNVSVTIEDGSTLESNIALGTGNKLVAGNDVNGVVVTAVKGNLTLGAGSEVHIGEMDSGGVISSGTVGILKVEGNISLSGTNVYLSVDGDDAIDRILSTGTLTLGTGLNESTINVKSTENWKPDTVYVLANYSSLTVDGSADISDAFILKGLTRQDLQYTNSGTQLSFKVVANQADWTWNGNVDNKWDVYDQGTDTDATANWTPSASGYQPNSFAGDGADNATFTNVGAGVIDVYGLVVGAGNDTVKAHNVTFQNTSGNNYTFNNGNLVANVIKLEGSGNATFNNSVEAAQIWVDGAGMLTLAKAGSKATEKVFIDNGSLVLGIAGALVDTKVDFGSASTGKLVSTVGTNTLKSLEGSSGTVDISGTTLQVESGNYSGKIVGTAASVLEKTGSGTLALSGLNATDFVDGTLTVSAGTIILNGANAVKTFNSTSGTTVTLGGDFTVSGGNSNGNIGGNGNLIVKGNLDLGGNNTFAGSLMIQNGTTKLTSTTAVKSSTAISIKTGAVLDLNGNDASASSLAAEAGSTVALNGGATLTSNAASNSTFDGDLTGTGKLVKEGAGVLTLTSLNNTFGGGLNINGGGISVSSDSSLGGGSVNIADTGKLIYTATADSRTRSFALSGTSGIEVTGSGSEVKIGDLNGSGTFVKSGDGLLELYGTNNYTGNYNVKSGTLKSSSDIILNDGQVLSGVGIVDANVIVNSGGKLAPGNSIGHQTITGNVDLNDGALLDFEVSSTADGSLAGISNSDRLNILGDLNLNGAVILNVSRENSTTKFTEENYKFLLVDMDTGSFLGSLSDITVAGSGNVFTHDYTLGLVLEGDDLYLTMKLNRPDYYKYTDGPNSSAVAEYLDNGWANANTFWKVDVASEVRAIGATDPGAVNKFLNQLSGYSLAHATQSRELASEHFRQLWSQRLTTGDATKFGFSKSTLTINPDEGSKSNKFQNAQSEMKESYWAQPFSYYTNMKNENHVSGYNYKSYGITGGFDSRWDTGYVGGLAFFYEDADVDVKKSSDKTDVEDTRFAVFGGWESENMTLILSGTYGLQRYDSHRYVNIGDMGGRNTADYDGNTYGAGIDFTAKMTEKLRFIAGFDYENITRDAFHEKGSDFAMNVKKEDYDTYASRLGLRYDVDFGNAVVYGLAAWKHRFDSNESAIEGYYTGVAGSFEANGVSPDKDSALLGLGVEYRMRTYYSIFADANADLGSGRSDIGANVGLRFTW